jgi:hypothetical protein
MRLAARRRKKRRIIQATEAGKETWPINMRELIPKQAARIMSIPVGTYNHAVSWRSQVEGEI